MKTRFFILIVTVLVAFAGCLQSTDNHATEKGMTESSGEFSSVDPELKAEFLNFCDSSYLDVIAQTEVSERVGARGFYWDSYAVRTLCVAYDMTGNDQYLNACKQWSERMIQFQQQMMPKGGYFMSYGRKPGEKEGNWFVADCSSIALAILATVPRGKDPAEKERFLHSVKSFAALVSDNYVFSSGGVANGFWPAKKDEWWCSTGIFGSLAFQLYKETGDESYLRTGLGTIDWLNGIDFETVAVHFKKPDIIPVVMMYCLEAYSAAFPFLDKNSERYRAALGQWKNALEWMKKNLPDKAGVDYVSQWGSKLGGLPFHIYTYEEFVPGNEELISLADRELDYCVNMLRNPELSKNFGEPEFDQQLDQLAIFTMFSYIQKLMPGDVYRAGGSSVK